MPDQLHACFICNSKYLVVLKRYHTAGLVRCKNCGFVFSKWIPTEQFLIEFYNNYPEYQHWNDITPQRYRTLLESFEKYRQTNNLLEVGSGEGFFLDEAKAKKWNVYGTEFIDRFIERSRARGMVMHQGKLNVENYTKESIDVLIWIEVIEHINDPVEELKKIYSLLRKGGIVYLTTPNFNSVSRLIMKEKLNLISYPNHLAYYTKSSLQSLFENNGFKKISLETTGLSPGRIISFLKGGDPQLVMNNETLQIDEPFRQRIETNKFLQISRNIANRILSLTGTGDSLKGLFIKI